ncbi:MAG: glycosyltransferase family A protein [Gemmatimonadaceae bacterium]
MRSSDPAITVIIPTRALRERAGHLRRAIDSVLDQRAVRVVPLVVINGSRRCAEIERSLRADARVRLLTRNEADLPAALRTGREAVDTPFFATLDDDDVLLPGALTLRARALERRPDCAAVVTNGYRRSTAGDVLNIPPGCDVNTDPLRALLNRNWLLPGSWLCRTDAVGIGVFEGMPRYLECTYLAVRFATEYRMVWLDAPTVVYQVGSPFAESASLEYLVGQVPALRRILALDLPDDVRRQLRARVAVTCHMAAIHFWSDGAVGEAWRWHAASLREHGGWRHLPFTRHLLRAALRRRP